MTRPARVPLLAAVPTLAGSVSVMLGLAGIVGWHTAALGLFQIAPGIAPLQYNAAIAILSLGIGFIVAAGGWRRAAALASIFPLGVGVLTLGEHLFDVSLGIDELLFHPYLSLDAAHPGRIAPNTAICSIAAALALLLVTTRRASDERPMLLGVLGSVLLGVGGLALAGYIGGVPQVYGWGPYTPMSPQAALAALALSGGVMRLAWVDAEEGSPSAWRWIPVAVAAVCFTSILVLWQAVLVLARRIDPGMTDIGNALAATLVTAAGMALMMAAVVFISQRATQAAADLRRLNDALQREQEQRSRAFLIAERLAAIVESSSDAIISADLDRRILTWNAGAERIYGYAASEAIGRPLSMLAADRGADELPAVVERLERGERMDHYETSRRRKDGGLVDVSQSVSAVRDESGHIVGLSAIARDVTERKRLEQARNELVAELQAALADVRTLSGLLPICAWCKKIRDDQGYWNQLEGYLNARSGISFSHGICPTCARKLKRPHVAE